MQRRGRGGDDVKAGDDSRGHVRSAGIDTTEADLNSSKKLEDFSIKEKRRGLTIVTMRKVKKMAYQLIDGVRRNRYGA